MEATRQVIETVMGWAEANLDQPLTVDVLARRAGYSPAHFARMFRVVAGETPASWLTGRRVGEAMRRLVATDAHLIEIAFACGFRDVTTFTRAFRRLAGRTPSAFRREKAIGGRLAPTVRLGDRVASPAFCLCGLSADVAADPEAPARLWQRLAGDLAAAGMAPDRRAFRQVAFWRDDPRRLYTCVAGFVAADGGRPPLPFLNVVVPACLCRSFVVDGAADSLAPAYDAVFDALLPASGDRQTGDFVIELPRRDGGEGVEIWIPVASPDRAPQRTRMLRKLQGSVSSMSSGKKPGRPSSGVQSV